MTSIVHPLFDECKRYTRDEFWREVLTMCSRNRFPVGVRYDTDKNSLFVKKNKKQEMYKLSPDDVQHTLVTLLSIFRSLGLRSAHDHSLQSRKMIEMGERKSKEIREWKDIKVKVRKDDLIAAFTDQITEDDADAKKIAAGIRNSLRFGCIKADDIVLKNGGIKEIYYVRVDEEQMRIVPTRTIVRKTKTFKTGSSPALKNTRAYVKIMIKT